METIAKAKKILLGRGIKITPQRIAVYGALDELEHACAEQIIERVHRKSPTITVATIYNVLDCFVKAGVISMVNTAQNRMYFDITTEDHHHLLATDCQRIADFSDPKLDNMIREYLDSIKIDNFQLEAISIQLKGKFTK